MVALILVPAGGKANYRSSQAKEVMLGSEPQMQLLFFFLSPRLWATNLFPNFLWLPTVQKTYSNEPAAGVLTKCNMITNSYHSILPIWLPIVV
jgi:hypothetical protein